MKIWELTITDANDMDKDYYFRERPNRMDAGTNGYVNYEGEMLEVSFSFRSREPHEVEVKSLGSGAVCVSLANVSSWSVHPRDWTTKEES